jgi:hypothetical protein
MCGDAVPAESPAHGSRSRAPERLPGGRQDSADLDAAPVAALPQRRRASRASQRRFTLSQRCFPALVLGRGPDRLMAASNLDTMASRSFRNRIPATRRFDASNLYLGGVAPLTDFSPLTLFTNSANTWNCPVTTGDVLRFTVTNPQTTNAGSPLCVLVGTAGSENCSEF